MSNKSNFEYPEEHIRREIEENLGVLLRQSRQRIEQNKVSPTLELESFRKDLMSYVFDENHDFEELLYWTVKSLEKGLVHMTHPGYFGLFNPSPTFAAECADRIVAAFNPQICVWSHAPAAVEIEQFVIQQVCHRIGYAHSGDGHFTSGGSEANHTSVICALTQAHPKFDDLGARVFSRQPRLYVSNESHLAWLKIAHQTGIGRDAVCLVKTDGHGRMDAAALSDAIVADIQQGNVPVFIGATAGTTNAGQVDPLRRCARIAQENNLWFHVDAAWGGALIADLELARALEGIELADSITIDAHKWFATTMGAGMFLTMHPKLLRETFRVSASYMPSHDAESDYYLNSMQWSRRFIGLRLFLSLAAGGWQAQAERMRRGIALIEYLTVSAEQRGWRVACASQMALVCLHAPKNIDVSSVVNEIVAKGQVWVSVAQFEGQSVLRACITHGETSQKQVDQLIQSLPSE